MRPSLLGGLSPARFMADYWQKRPLLVRQAIPDFAGLIDRDGLLQVATRDDAVSRLVVRRQGRHKTRWERHDGPFDELDASMLPAKKWTLLVHGLESLVPGGWELLRNFDFIPAARIDDVMVSYAADGGSVGPHVDDYDVFLLQGPGRRRWQVARRYDPTPDPRAAIKVLRDFIPEDEWVLDPGDMLYLPPHVAHHGVAEAPCFTYSIGFLAPTRAQLQQSFLGWLGNTLPVDEARYADRGRKPTRDTHGVDRDLLAFAGKAIGQLPLGDRDRLEEFVGCFLTRPKAHVRFPTARAYKARGTARLSLPTRALVQGSRLYVNGRAFALARNMIAPVRALVRERACKLPSPRLDDLLRDLHAEGWLTLD